MREIREISAHREEILRRLDGVVVGVCLDEDREKARAALAEMGNPFRSAFNGGFWSGTVARAWGVQAIPRAWLEGPDGRILRREVFVQEFFGPAIDGR